VSEDRKSICGMPEGDLIDLTWGKLSPERAEEVRAHATGCAECTAELENLKEARESVGSVADVAPSAGFRENLMARLHASPSSHAPGPASRRYARIVEHERSALSWVRPRWRLLVLATAAAATLSAVMLSRLWVFDKAPRPTGPVVAMSDSLRRRAVFARHAERMDCVRGVETEVIGGTLDLANSLGDGGILGDILGEEEIVLAGVEDIDQHESCIMAFRVADWASFERRHESTPEGPARKRFEAIVDSKRMVSVVDGRIEMPEDLLARHIGGTSVVILKLHDRAEIWAPKTLKTYIGLPPFRIELEGVTLAPSRDAARKS